jgi:hypothetical protein
LAERVGGYLNSDLRPTMFWILEFKIVPNNDITVIAAMAVAVAVAQSSLLIC